jgi:two-component system, NarL family, sensor histidine kinase BarA
MATALRGHDSNVTFRLRIERHGQHMATQSRGHGTQHTQCRRSRFPEGINPSVRRAEKSLKWQAMSYRAFKRLLGETSLERKCRFLFGAGIVVLITLSFWLYAYLTEHLAYDQAVTSCRLLVNPLLYQWHLPILKSTGEKKLTGTELVNSMTLSVKDLPPDGSREYQFDFLVKGRLEDPYERELFREFLSGESDKKEDKRSPRPNEQTMVYYAPIRVEKSCLDCHVKAANAKGLTPPQENDLIALLRIRMPTGPIEQGVHWNWALLMTTAFGTAMLIMIGSWLIIRYIIVKPVKHLKEVSDLISSGQINVRSEIQTGDEFEDLSHAFNRMLRNLVSMQDQYRQVNVDLNEKVDELAQANMALYESNRLKSDFLATMSHELRTPLNSIIGFSDVLLSTDAMADKQRRWVGNIQSSGQRLLNLINDILDLAKIEAGKMQVRLEEFHLPPVAEGVIAPIRPMAERKNIDLRVQIDPDLPTLRQDPTKVQQILQNLLSNAIKFTPEGGRVVLKADADPRFITITVTDTGIGIAPEEQELVFQKFRRSGNPLTRENPGTGLGLSISRELAKLLGGEITLKSELGQGSTFTVRLPIWLTHEPNLDVDVAEGGIDLTKAHRVDLGDRPTTERPALPASKTADDQTRSLP